MIIAQTHKCFYVSAGVGDSSETKSKEEKLQVKKTQIMGGLC